MDEQARIWCEQNNPGIKRDFPSLNGDIEPALCAALISGSKTDDKLLKNIIRERQPSSLSKSEFEEALKEFVKNPLVGCTTLLDMARIASGYNPNALHTGFLSFAMSTVAFENYIRKALEMPFFKETKSTTNTYERKDLNWQNAISQIANICGQSAQCDTPALRTQMVNLAYTAASHDCTNNRSSLFTINAVNYENQNSVYAYFFTTSITMRLVKGGRKSSDSIQSQVSIRSVKLSFDVNRWRDNARSVLESHVKLVDNWLSDNSTRQGNLNVKLCIE